MKSTSILLDEPRHAGTATEEVPLAITNRGLYSQTAPKWVFDAYLGSLRRWTFNQAEVLFTYRDMEGQERRGIGVRSNIEVVMNGSDINGFTPDGPADGQLNSPAVLFVGQLIDRKGISIDALRAVASTPEIGIDATLYVTGTGPVKSEMVSCE